MYPIKNPGLNTCWEVQGRCIFLSQRKILGAVTVKVNCPISCTHKKPSVLKLKSVLSLVHILLFCLIFVWFGFVSETKSSCAAQVGLKMSFSFFHLPSSESIAVHTQNQLFNVFFIVCFFLLIRGSKHSHCQ